MKKFVMGLLIALILIILLLLIYVMVTSPPIMRGMAAKTMCSCVYVMGRSPESVLQKELQEVVTAVCLPVFDSIAQLARLLS